MHLSPTVLSEHCSMNLVSATYMHTHTHTHTYRHTHTHVGGVTHKVGKAPWCGLSALATVMLIHFSSCPTYLFRPLSHPRTLLSLLPNTGSTHQLPNLACSVYSHLWLVCRVVVYVSFNAHSSTVVSQLSLPILQKSTELFRASLVGG